MAAVKDRPAIEGDGTPAAAWLAWSGLAALAPLDIGALAAPGARAVVLAAHPDDEVLGCGLLLSALARAGRGIVLLAATDGDASHPGSACWTPDALRSARPRETLAALACLGLQARVERLRLPDGELQQHVPAMARALEGVLRPGDLLLTHWRGDAHPDHEAAAVAALAVAAHRDVRVAEFPVWAWHWATPQDAPMPWARARRLDADGATRDAKVRALACYASQLSPDASTGRGAVVPPSALERARQLPEVFFL